MFKLDESKDLVIYKLLLTTLEEYVNKFPGTGISKYLDHFLEAGKGSIPKNERAQNILLWVLTSGTCGEAIAWICGKRFSDLPVMIRPSYKEVDVIKVANFGNEEKSYDLIGSLLGWDGDTHKDVKGDWVGCDGKKVDLINAETD